jgi:hypothetical protein
MSVGMIAFLFFIEAIDAIENINPNLRQ